MPSDVDSVLYWSRVFLIIASICVTAFPILYAFSPWYRSRLGWAVMLQSLSVALAVDISAIVNFKEITSLALILLINVGILAFISVTSLYLTITLLYYNYKPRKENTKDVRRHRSRDA